MTSGWFTLKEAADQLKLSRQALDNYRKRLKGKLYQKEFKHNGRKRVQLSAMFIREVKRLQQQSKQPFIISRPTEAEGSDPKKGNNDLRLGLNILEDGRTAYVYDKNEYEALVYTIGDYNRMKAEYEEVKKKLDQATERLFKALENSNAIQQQLNYLEAQRLKDKEKN